MQTQQMETTLNTFYYPKKGNLNIFVMFLNHLYISLIPFLYIYGKISMFTYLYIFINMWLYPGMISYMSVFIYHYIYRYRYPHIYTHNLYVSYIYILSWVHIHIPFKSQCMQEWVRKYMHVYECLHVHTGVNKCMCK